MRSLSKNKSVLEELLCELVNFPDILAIFETKLTDEKVNCAKIPNYNFVFSNSSTNAGDVIFYMLNKLHFTRRHYLEFKTDDTKNVFVEVKLNTRKENVIGLIYRHLTSNFTEFQDKFTSILNQLKQNKQDYVICGHFNIDQIKLEKNSKIDKYFNAVYAEGCINLINKPTRITENSATLLDHLYSNLTNHITHIGILTFDVPDHLPTFCCLSLRPVKKLNKIIVHDLKNFDRTKFLDDVDELVIKINSHYMRDNDFNPETILEMFLNSFSEIVNLHAPLRTLTRKELHLSSKPWISKSVLKSIKKKKCNV